MLFSTPAANVTGKADKACLMHKDISEIKQILECRPKFEKGRVWSLQSTSQFEFSAFESCVRNQDQLMTDTNVASTMTLRTWCFCDAENDTCPPDALNGIIAAVYRTCEAQATPLKECKAAVDQATKDFNEKANSPPDPNARPLLRRPDASGRNSSSIRLYPPP
jgi:hypothetical protein